MRYVAFLRAINVGGRFVKMDRLRGLFSEMGFGGVSTHIASGNVLFTAGRARPARLEETIETALAGALGYEVTTFLRTADELAAVAAHEAFPLEPAVAAHGTFVGFLKEPPSVEQARLVEGLETPTDGFAVRGREVYWLCRVRSMKAIASPGRVEKALRQRATFRNATTVRQVARLLGASA